MHKLSKTIDNFYSNNLKQTKLQLFLVQRNWRHIVSTETAKYAEPHNVTTTKNQKILTVKITETAIANELSYRQTELFKKIRDKANVDIQKLRFLIKTE